MFQPRFGDVLITNAHLLGMLTKVLKFNEFISAEFYYLSYPPDNYLDASESASIPLLDMKFKNITIK